METQQIEYKQSWRDEYLKWICGFANAQGGRIFIGVTDDGEVIGVEDYRRLLEDIPNKTINHLSFVVDVNHHTKGGKHYLEIVIPESSVPISYHGTYHYRSGATKQELKGVALQNWLLKKVGKHWEDLPVPSVTLADLDESTVRRFLKIAISHKRIPAEAADYSTRALLESLHLVTKEGHPTNAAVLLFGKNPTIASPTCGFKIGALVKGMTIFNSRTSSSVTCSPCPMKSSRNYPIDISPGKLPIKAFSVSNSSNTPRQPSAKPS